MKKEQAVKAIIQKGNKVLILKQKVGDNIYYALPGGRIKGNDYEVELKREIREETNLEIEVGDYVGDWSFSRPNGDITNCRIYGCKPMTEIISDMNSDEVEEIKSFLWLTKVQLEENEILLDEKLKRVILTSLNQ